MFDRPDGLLPLLPPKAALLGTSRKPSHPLVPSLSHDAVRAAQPGQTTTATRTLVPNKFFAFCHTPGLLLGHIGRVTDPVG